MARLLTPIMRARILASKARLARRRVVRTATPRTLVRRATPAARATTRRNTLARQRAIALARQRAIARRKAIARRNAAIRKQTLARKRALARRNAMLQKAKAKNAPHVVKPRATKKVTHTTQAAKNVTHDAKKQKSTNALPIIGGALLAYFMM